MAERKSVPAMALACALLAGAAASCGGSTPSPTPTAPVPVEPGGPPSPPPAPAIISVAISLPAGGDAALIPAERAQLKATATRDDGTSADCTADALWATGAPAIVTFSTATPGEARAVASGQATVVASCGGVASKGLVLSVGGGLRITGLEAYPFFVTGGVLARLNAIETDNDGRDVADCGTRADWSSSNRDFASFNALTRNQILFHRPGAHASGEVTLTVRCNGQTSSVTVPMRSYRLSGTVRTPDGEPIAGMLITEKYSNVAVTTDNAGVYTVDLAVAQPEIIVSRLGYETYTAGPQWNAQPDVRLDVTIAAIPAVVATGSGKACNLKPADARFATECTAAGAAYRPSHTFTLDRAGDIRVKTYWPDPPGGSGIDDNLIVDLVCDGTMVYSGEIYGVQGGGFTRHARAGACIMTFINPTLLRVLPYEFTVDVR